MLTILLAHHHTVDPRLTTGTLGRDRGGILREQLGKLVKYHGEEICKPGGRLPWVPLRYPYSFLSGKSQRAKELKKVRLTNP